MLAAEPRIEVVAIAASGVEAIAMAEQSKPDLVLMDLSMPGMNGFEATRRIKARDDAPRVVIMTLNGGAPYGAFLEAVMADGFLSKVDFVEDIKALLRDFFHGSGESSPKGRA